ncbi:NINE protein [Corynebacterium timonense]|uniref:TM2 domain-containing membrane protein YozV n=1 Tax=Corynebacterium timonense TaxID=441500 RepID=A0A1H1L658_9CORY|nr:NINE protein [Corynebacterium timonense]SDR69772.1 TM2 domain-containing membrane protein YozV [Corynebacterium timonense]
MSSIYPSPSYDEYDEDGLPLKKPRFHGGHAPRQSWTAHPQQQPPSSTSGYPATYSQAPYSQSPYSQAPYSQSPYSQAPYAPAPYPQVAYQPAPKSKVVAALLFFFFGSFGLGNFYLHQNTRGAAKLIMVFVGFITAIFLVGFLLLAAVSMWSFIEMILVLVGAGGYDRDGRGVPVD